MSRYWSADQRSSSDELARERFETMGLSEQEQELMMSGGIGRIAETEWVSDLRQQLADNMPPGLAIYMRRFPSVTYATGHMLAANPNYSIQRNERGAADPKLSVDAFLAGMYDQGKLGEISKREITVPYLGRLMLTPIKGRASLLVAHIGDYYPEEDMEDWHGMSEGQIESEREAIETAAEEEGAEEAKIEDQRIRDERANEDNPPADWEERVEAGEYQPERTRHKLHLGVIKVVASTGINGRKRKAEEVIRTRIEKNLKGEIILKAVGITPVSAGMARGKEG